MDIPNEIKALVEAGALFVFNHSGGIVPLCNPIVCGLHVPWNMCIITLDDNIRKSNNWWPDMPLQQLPLLEL